MERARFGRHRRKCALKSFKITTRIMDLRHRPERTSEFYSRVLAKLSSWKQSPVNCFPAFAELNRDSITSNRA